MSFESIAHENFNNADERGEFITKYYENVNKKNSDINELDDNSIVNFLGGMHKYEIITNAKLTAVERGI